MLGDEVLEDLEIALDQSSFVHAELATGEIESVNTVRALVDLRDARIANELLHAPLTDVSVAAEYLHG